jgi:hypothetical protein
MFKLWPYYILLLCVQPRVSAQNAFGLGAAIHLYDQVISLKGMRTLPKGCIGMELGIGVERSLQGAVAPQLALFWQAPLPSKNRHTPFNRPYYSLRYQFDFQNAGFLDTYHGIYGGLGYAFGLGARHSFLLQLGLGVVVEKMYIPNTSTSQTHSFLNPQVQLNYYFRNHSK